MVSRLRQHGLTLVELLVTLSVLSLGALIAVSSMNRALPQRALNHAAEQLVTDLKRARLHAQKHGVPVAVSFEEKRYASDSIRLSRILESNIVIQTEESADEIVFSQSFATLGGSIVLQIEDRRVIIKTDPIIGKITRVD